MAMKRGQKLGISDDSEYLSDDSDFYGDETVKRELERRATSFSPAEWWGRKILSPTEMANLSIKSASLSQTATLYNPYEGQRCGRQLGETVDEFLQRLPPSTTMKETAIPWIFISNPFRKAPRSQVEYSQYWLANEGPPDEESDWAQFVRVGEKLLEELTSIKHAIEKKRAGQSKATIAKAVNVEKEVIVQKLLDKAVELHCTSGKWMMFYESSAVDAVWSIIAHATASNELGIAAKVAPDEGDRRGPRLICIYTKDFTDMEDVTRVISKMRDLGLINVKGKPIYYKCDAYTYLNIKSGNEYNIKASLYNSADVLNPKDTGLKSQRLDGSFYKR